VKFDRAKEVDAHVGSRVRLRRTLLGMTQPQLGEAVGLTFQQIQKYERGSNRISAGRLYHLSTILEVPVSFFFDCLPAEKAGPPPHASRDHTLAGEADWMSKREAPELVRAYYRISDPAVRRRAREIVKIIADLAANTEETD